MIGLTITQKVMLGTSLLGVAAGVVGSFAVLRRRALVGDMLAHAALPGLCLGFLLAGGRSYPALLLGAFLAGLLGIAIVSLVCRWTRTKEDAAIGIVLSSFFGLGIVLLTVIQQMPTGGKAGLNSFLFGQAASLRNQDLLVITATGLVSLAVLALLYKELQAFSFDPQFAESQGWPATGLDMVMMGLLAVVTIVGLPAIGVVLMVALIITPAAAARFWTDRLGQMLLLAGVVGGSMALAGTWLSAGRGLPTGPSIVLCGTALFVFSLLFGSTRGVLTRAFAHWRLQRRTADENLLRTLYELGERELPRRKPQTREAILSRRAWTPQRLRRIVSRAAQDGIVERSDEGVWLTEAGLARAAELTRTHRMWELYLIEGAGIAPDHVDRDADSIEHLLTPEIRRELEQRLAEVGKLPTRVGVLPESPHDLGEVMEGGDA